jgi:outer membrane protein
VRLCLLFLSAAVAFAQPQTAPMTLAQAEQLALQNHPRLAQARLNASASEQVPIEVHAARLPQLSGSLTGVGADDGGRIAAGFLNNPVLYSRLGAGVTFSELITDFGRTAELEASARLHAQAQNQNAETTREQILLTVNRAFFDQLRAEALLKVAQGTVDARQAVADQVAALQRAALRSTLDVSFANTNLSDAKLLLASAENNIRSAQAELAAALGLSAQGPFVLVPEPLPGALPDSVQPLLADALRDRPDAAALRLDQESAQRFATAEKDLSKPTVSALGVVGVAPAGVSQVPWHYGAAGINLNLPILNGHLFKARQTEAELRAQAASQAVLDLQLRINRDVNVAYLDSQTAFQRLGLTAEFLQNARTALDLAQTRFNLGLGTIVELSQAQLNVTAAEIAQSSAQYDYQSDRADLAYQTGALR